MPATVAISNERKNAAASAPPGALELKHSYRCDMYVAVSRHPQINKSHSNRFDLRAVAFGSRGRRIIHEQLLVRDKRMTSGNSPQRACNPENIRRKRVAGPWVQGQLNWTF
jgi:hypothetical protein